MTESVLVGLGDTTSTATASTSWFATYGAQGPTSQADTTEADAQLKMRGTPTLKNMYCRVTTNGRAQASTVKSRQNGANAGPSVSITGSTTGNFSDTSGNVTFADGDTWDVALTTGSGAGSLIVASITAELQYSSAAKTFLSTFGSIAITALRYINLGGTIASTATEVQTQQTALETATLDKLQCIVTLNASTGYTVKTRKNTANGGQSISVGNAATGFFEDTSGTDSLVAGDVFNVVVSAPSASTTLTAVGVRYASAAAGTGPAQVAKSGVNTLAAATTRYSSMFGAPVGNATESLVQAVMPFAATLSKLSCYVPTNASTTSVTLISRKGGANGGQSVSIAGGATGLFHDLSGTDTVAATDMVNTQMSGSDGNVSFSWIGMLVTQSTAVTARRMSTLGVG